MFFPDNFTLLILSVVFVFLSAVVSLNVTFLVFPFLITTVFFVALIFFTTFALFVFLEIGITFLLLVSGVAVGVAVFPGVGAGSSGSTNC